MTIEEAIKNREECLKYLEGLGAMATPENVEAVRWSLKALRAYVEKPPCYLEEKDNPYPLCVGRGFANCAHCCLWADFDENQDESRVNHLLTQACGMCNNAHTDPELNSDNDLSYISIGEHEKGYRALLRSGDGRPTAILFEKWTDGVGWTTIGHYQPKDCPNCGRELKENDHGPRKQATKIEARPWKPQDLLDDLQSIIDEEPDRYLNTRRTTLCTALAYLKEYFSETQPFPELTRGEIATEYLSICDEHDCTGDQSVGIQPCPFYKWPDVDDSGAPLPSGCKLKAMLKEATK